VKDSALRPWRDSSRGTPRALRYDAEEIQDDNRENRDHVHGQEAACYRPGKALRGNFRVPIIMMSANRSHSKEIAVDAGANDFLTKPFSFLDLLERIEASLRPAAP
jgi:CheY-like chemotaxis protein